MPWSFFFRPARSWTVFRRVLALLAIALACGLSTVSEATVVDPSSSGWSDFSGRGPNCSSYTCTAQQACMNQLTDGDVASGKSLSSIGLGVSGTAAMCYFTINGNVVPGTWIGRNGPYVPPPSCPAAGASAPGGNTANGTSPTQTILNPHVCVGGCTYNYSSYWTGATPGQTGGYPAQYTGLSSTGSACSGTGTPSAAQPSPTDPPKQCGAKQYSGTVNGANVCIDYPIQTTGGQTSTTTTDAPASSPAASNSSTRNSSTTCDGTTCTTTTVVVGGGGGVGGGGSGSGGAASGVAASPCSSTQVSTGAAVPGGPGTCTTTTQQPQQQYCQQNPSADQCKQDSASGGADCSAPPTCSGDAISCAILSQQWNTRCDLQKSVDPSIQLGQQIQAGNDPMAGKLPTPGGADQVDMSSKFANVDDMGFVAQCLPDLNIPLALPGGATTLHISTSPLCDIGKLLGYLNMLSTLMLCVYMLKGSF